MRDGILPDFGRMFQQMFDSLEQKCERFYYMGLRDGAIFTAIGLIVAWILFRGERK